MLLRKTNVLRTVSLALFVVGSALLDRQALADGAKDKPAPPPPPAKKADRYGDPLPFGAVARLGTVRFRYDATCVAYSPDGKLLAAGGADNGIRLFDAASGKEVRRLAGHQPRTYEPPLNPKSPLDALVSAVGKGNVTSISFSPDGKTLASGGWDDMVRLWDVDSGTELRRMYAHKAMVAAVVFAPKGKVLASRGGLDGVVRLWDPPTGNEIRKYEGLAKINPWRFNRFAALAFAPDGKTLAAGDRNVIHFWDVAGGKEKKSLKAHLGCLSVAYSPDGKLLASGGVDGKDKNSIRIWDLAQGKELRRCKLLKDEPPIDLAFSPDNGQLAAVIEEDDMHLYDVATGKPVRRLNHYWASRVAYAPGGKTLASARGQTVRLWDPKTGKELFQKYEGHRAGVVSVALSRDGKRVASGGDGIRLWEAATGKLLLKIEVKGPVAALAFSPNGRRLASAGRDRVVHVWDVDSGKEVAKFPGHKHALCGVAYSPDGKLLASGDVQCTICIWEVKTGQKLHQVDVFSGAESLSLAFAPDSKTLACGGAWNDSSFLPAGGINIQGVKMTPKKGYLVLQWDVSTGKEVRRFAGPAAKIKSIAFSPDGKVLAAGSADGKICLWDAATGRERLHILAHPKHEEADFTTSPAVAFSPDSKLLASASTDKGIRFWDAATAKERGQIRSPDGGFYCLAFGKDGKAVVSGSGDSTVLVWDWQTAVKAPLPKKPHVIYIK
jgi:WD40 repeat protein